MGKITIIGAGSTIFCQKIVGDCMLIPALQHFEIATHDIDLDRLKVTESLLNTMRATLGSTVRITAYADRREALSGAKYVINTILVGGLSAVELDVNIPAKYGLRQTIADTIGVGGLFRSLRTIPVMLDFARDIREVCPNALMLNYTNPMSALTAAMNVHGGVNTVGLCHSVQLCVSKLLTPLGIDTEDVQWKIAGINHMAWLLEVTRDGEDLYPLIKQRSKELAADNENDRVRHEIMHRYGYYVTESSIHSPEYYPHFIKRSYPELIERYNIPLDKCLQNLRGRERKRIKEKEEFAGLERIEHERSIEYGSMIIEAIETNVPFKFGGNVMNTGLITNLPREACVEVSCIADRSGVAATFVGDLPQQLAALNRNQINTQLMTVEAAITLKREHIYQAAFLDPHTAAELSLDDIVAMCDELIEAHGDMLPQYI